ncbi:MAG: M23 family metallopeptidase, partial [Paraburkholderia fungorum]|nr:M23 family metallopeptidase [Paraburkholderia fungorum]
MIISPPFLPTAGTTSSNGDVIDVMMDAVDQFELAHGVYPIAFDRRWHTGVHLMPSTQNERVRAIADGEVLAYRVCQTAIDGGGGVPDSNPGFVLLKHSTETGEGRPITFYSLYMHLLELDGYSGLGVDASTLPEFLRTATAPEGQAGSGKKVYRKDVLGLPGRCHGQRHIHFEIFMLPSDFNTYFGSTSLDNKHPATPISKDYWGHSYYVIPADQTYLSKPTGTDASNKLKNVEFTPLQGGTNAGYSLFVESYFHAGSKYTNTWRVDQDDTRTLLTPQPVKEAGYEYDLYARATNLYPDCPSDGYELLRFGRILTEHPTLQDGAISTPEGIAPGLAGNPHPMEQANPCTTWMRVTFAQGQEGYIDVNGSRVVQLSDADFPFFMGWTKISEGNTPYSDDGMCDVEELKKIVGDIAPKSPDAKEYEDEDSLSDWIKGNDVIREKLRGFICEAPTEWNSSHNDTRYAELNEPDGFYGKQKQTNPTGYSDFLDLLKKFQFWDKTGLPEGKLWFFHPLQFIRHFRKCGWLSEKEFKQLLPTEVLREASGQTMYFESIPNSYAVGPIAKNHRIPLNKAFRKYNIATPNRMSALLGNSLQETQWLSKLHENNSGMWYYPWDGRGFLQLTHPDNYIKYWDFRGRKSQISQATRDAIAAAKGQANAHRPQAQTYIADAVSGATPIMIQWREDVGDNT